MMTDSSISSEGIIKQFTDKDFKVFQLPQEYKWINIDPYSDTDINDVYEFLSRNYVEDCTSEFRLSYSKSFLKWYMRCPNYTKNTYLAIVDRDNRFIGFITGIPTTICLRNKEFQTNIANFLCIRKEMRDLNLAPILIYKLTEEITKHYKYTHAIYTLSKTITKPFSKCQYWHREINTEKLLDIGFSQIPECLKDEPDAVNILKEYYKVLDDQTYLMREFKSSDAKAVAILLNSYLSKFDVHTVFAEEDAKHWFTPVNHVIYSYVFEKDNNVTDFISFVEIDSTILQKDSTLRTAMLFYFVPGVLTVKELINKAVVYAKINKFDVFNAYDIMDMKDVLEDLKFDAGSGKLVYNFYNYRIRDVDTSNMAVVLL